MKKKDSKKKNLQIPQAFKILTYLFAAVLVSSCSRKIVFPVSEIVPAAEAEVHIEQNESDNYDVALEVQNLARPERLTPSGTNYTTWMVTRRNGIINIGNLKVKKNGNAVLKTTTAYEPIRIFITAEDDPQPRTPSNQIVLNSGDLED